MAKHAGAQGGRPLKFKSVALLQEKIDAYFTDCDPHWIEEEYYDHPFVKTTELESQPHGGALKRNRLRDYDAPMEKQLRWMKTEQEPYLITGLCEALGTYRDVLIDYENGNRDLLPGDEGYDKDVPRFSNAIKAAKLKCERFAEGKLYNGKNATGPIFNLKNNYRWKDTAEVIQDTNVTVITRNSGSHVKQPVGAPPDNDEDDADD